MHPEDQAQNFTFPKFILGLWTAKMRSPLPTVYFGALLTLPGPMHAGKSLSPGSKKSRFDCHQILHCHSEWQIALLISDVDDNNMEQLYEMVFALRTGGRQNNDMRKGKHQKARERALLTSNSRTLRIQINAGPISRL